MRFTAPTIYQGMIEALKHRPMAGLGGFTFNDFLDTLVTVGASKEISEDERKAKDKELALLKENNAALEKQIKLELQLQESKNRGLTLAQKAGMAGDSVLNQLAAKPWAVPAVIALTVAFFRMRGKGRGRR